MVLASMGINYSYSYSLRSRGWLRKRKNNPNQLRSYISRKQYFSPGTLHVYHRPPTAEKDRMLPSGYTVGQTWGALHKAWLGYCIALYKNEDDKTLYYASIIQKLQRELGIQVREFDMFGSVMDKEESKLAVIDPFTNEKIQDAKEDEDDYLEYNPNRI